MGKKAVFKFFYFISIILTFAIAIFGIIGAYVYKILPNDWFWATFIGIAVPLILIINALVLIYWLIRFKCWMWLPIIALAFNWQYISSMVNISKSHNEKLIDITVATYNVHGFDQNKSFFSHA